jgi:hypothetical protein
MLHTQQIINPRTEEKEEGVPGCFPLLAPLLSFCSAVSVFFIPRQSFPPFRIPANNPVPESSQKKSPSTDVNLSYLTTTNANL